MCLSDPSFVAFAGLEHDAEKWVRFSEEHHAQLIGIDHVHAF
jgi:hypothetical protein